MPVNSGLTPQKGCKGCTRIRTNRPWSMQPFWASGVLICTSQMGSLWGLHLSFDNILGPIFFLDQASERYLLHICQTEILLFSQEPSSGTQQPCSSSPVIFPVNWGALAWPPSYLPGGPVIHTSMNSSSVLILESTLHLHALSHCPWMENFLA